jgi:hypothetical protein
MRNEVPFAGSWSSEIGPPHSCRSVRGSPGKCTKEPIRSRVLEVVTGRFEQIVDFLA